jgi:hypothetical protein
VSSEHDYDGHGGHAPDCRACRVEKLEAELAEAKRERDALATPPRRPPEPECDSCGERHLPQVMCPPHEVRRGTRNTMAVKPQGDDT